MINDDTIFVYHMGKVASTALVKSIYAYGRHALFCQWMSDEAFDFLKSRNEIKNDDHAAAYLRHIERLREQVDHSDILDRVKAISVVRDPVGNIISNFFQNWQEMVAHVAARYGTASDENIIAFIQESCSAYLEYRDWPLKDWSMATSIHPFMFRIILNPLRFFDAEVRAHMGIDVFGYPRPDPYVYCRNLLLLKYERLSECTAEVGRFINIPDFRMIHDNVGAEKPGGDVYGRIKNRLNLPAAFLDFIYATRYARHFYGADEIAGFRRRWEAA